MQNVAIRDNDVSQHDPESTPAGAVLAGYELTEQPMPVRTVSESRCERRREAPECRAPVSLVRRTLAAAAAIAIVGLPSLAWAVAAAEPPVEVRLANGYWSEGKPRWFVSTKSDLGGIYIKPYFSFGYGLPHWIWAGVDVNATSTIEFGQVYGGFRASLPVLDFAFGVRDAYSYWKNFLDPQATFVSADLGGPGKNARYWAWEAEAVAVLPLPHSAILLNYIAVGLPDLPHGKYIYEETYRAIVADRFFQVFRVAALARLLREDALKVGVLTELLTSTGRGQNVFRMGPAAALQLTDHLEALGTLSVAVSSPDRLGLALGAFGLGGFRYRWATGERAPKFPWQGPMIP